MVDVFCTIVTFFISNSKLTVIFIVVFRLTVVLGCWYNVAGVLGVSLLMEWGEMKVFHRGVELF